MRCSRLLVVATMLLGLATAGCAVNQSYSLMGAEPELGLQGQGTVVAVMSQDQREYVLSGRNNPWLAGIMRGGWGNPFYVSIKDRTPLSTEMNAVLVRTLTSQGFKTREILPDPSAEWSTLTNQLKTSGADRGVYLKITEWKPDLGTGGRLGLSYDLTLMTLSENGETLASSNVSGKDDIGVIKGFSRITERYGEYTASAFGEKVEQLFADPKVARSLL